MIKVFNKILSVVFPKILVKRSIDIISNPKIRKLRSYELETINSAKKKTILFKGFDIRTYEWGNGHKKVLLIHGWEGQAGNFSDLIPKLLAKDYTVYSFDALSHGFSEKGKNSFFEFIELAALMIKTFNANNLVSHSFGGTAAIFALYDNPEIVIERYALLTVPDKFMQRIETVSKQIGLNNNVKERLIAELEKNLPWPVHSANVSNKVKNINVKKALIVHDKDDKVLPISHAKNVCRNWKECDFEEVKGTGHFRILRTNNVLEKVADFLG